MTNEYFEQYLRTLASGANTDRAWNNYLAAVIGSAKPSATATEPAIQTPAVLTMPSDRPHYDPNTCGYTLDTDPERRCGQPAVTRGRGTPRCVEHLPHPIWP